MPIPKSLKPRVEKFITIVLNKVLNGELERGFFKRGTLDPNYTISLYAMTLLPQYTDSRIELCGDINGVKIPISILSCDSLTHKRLDKTLVDELVESYIKLRIKEIK